MIQKSKFQMWSLLKTQPTLFNLLSNKVLKSVETKSRLLMKSIKLISLDRAHLLTSKITVNLVNWKNYTSQVNQA